METMREDMNSQTKTTSRRNERLNKLLKELQQLKSMYRKIAIASSVLFLLGILVGFIGFPSFLHHMLRKQVTLKPGSEVRPMWEKIPFPLNFGIYVFNVTNPEEVQNGGKPKLHEVGPFMFEEWKDKYNVEDIEEEDAVTFNMRNTFIFRPDLGLSGEELITMPHPLIQVMSIAIKRDRAAMINMISEGLTEMFHPTSPFISAPFMDIFFRGIGVDCSSNHFAATAICLNFHTEGIKGAVKVNETYFKFSLMGGANHTDAGFFKVSRGIKKAGTVGKVLEFDGEEEISNWNGEYCNEIRGTDSTIFSPLMERDNALEAFSADLCRSLKPTYERPDRYNGIPVLRYTLSFGDVKYEPQNQCFCKSYPDNCPPRGTIDLSPCNDAPMFASLPHFLDADPKLVSDVEGLCPSEERHGIYMLLEIITGSPLTAARRLQFNLQVIPIPELEVMKNMRPLLMPLFWVEESIALTRDFTDDIKNKVFLTLKINSIFKWFSVVIGTIGLIISAYLHFTYKNNKITVRAPPSTVDALHDVKY